MRTPVCNIRRCVQMTAFGADDVPDVKISAHREVTSGSMPGSSVDCSASAAGKPSSTTRV